MVHTSRIVPHVVLPVEPTTGQAIFSHFRRCISLPLFAAAALSYPTASNDRFDYVIIGGGTSGLVVANRLSELKNVTVAVIEAGGSVYDNANVTDLGGYGKAFGTSIDYAYETVGQKYGGNKTQTLRAGKALGGTSTINGMAYTRAQNAQIDIWEKVSNDGWNWDNLVEYYKKSETLERPTAEQAAHGATFIPEPHGTNGPLKVGWKPNMEVILSAGSLRSPLLLEQSGVGNPSILKAAGIDTKVVLPTVGENLQDQMNNGLAQASTKNFTGATTFVAYPNVDDVFADRTAALAADVKRKLPRWARQTSERTNGAVTTPQLAAFLDIQYDLIFTSKVPLAEILVTPVAGAFSTEYWALLPFARGNIHVRRAGSSAARIDPNYFMMDWDMTEQVGAAKFIRRLYNTAPLSEYFAGETKPGLDVVAEDAEDDVWSHWITENYRSNFHPVGTTAMMSKELGGVVDANLKVYGTSNVRVVDAGILPFQVCGHLVSTLYAVAEKASDIIKASA
ncbi:Glucose oxidase [Colletotrichum trifolii]|uniref:Glucose oxidase n=1 Tax=Colletotrichum trifolii TaxID=5466 RepID=A0A4R8RQ57_COLTR|nr:Glucose oxidase [Colletotrichum trifolii]